MMRKLRLFLPAFVMALAVTAAGCADHPVAGSQHQGATAAPGTSSKSKVVRYDVPIQVLEAAADMGYRPREYQGRILFCQTDSEVGSLIPRLHCVDAATLITTVEGQRQAIRRLQRSNAGCYQSSTCNP